MNTDRKRDLYINISRKQDLYMNINRKRRLYMNIDRKREMYINTDRKREPCMNTDRKRELHMNTDRKQRIRKNLANYILFLAIMALTFYTVLRGQDWNQIGEALRRLSLPCMLMIFAAALFFVWKMGFLSYAAFPIPLSDFFIPVLLRPPRGDSRCSSTI